MFASWVVDDCEPPGAEGPAPGLFCCLWAMVVECLALVVPCSELGSTGLTRFRPCPRREVVRWDRAGAHTCLFP